jgi:prepilin-type N-terminal cleavage/methylation domain-containing protein
MTRDTAAPGLCFKANQGFTLVELLVVFLILAILSQMALMYLSDIRKRSSDAVAISEGRGLINAISQAFLDQSDVKMQHGSGLGGGPGAAGATGAVGTLTLSDNPRTPIYSLTDKVKADIEHIIGDPASPFDDVVTVSVWHMEGSSFTGAGANNDQRKEFTYMLNLATNDTTMASW